MSSISSTTASQTQATQRPAHAHRNRVASEIDSEPSAGTISSTDATALTSALDAIDASLKSGSASNDGTSGATSTKAASRLDPSEIKSRVDGLIADQVTNGTLTGDQATTLSALFAKDGPNDRSDAGALGAAGGPPPGPPPSLDDASDPSSTPSVSSASGSTSTASTSDLLASFIKQLQATQTRATGYAATGSTSANSNASALLFDFRS